MMLYLLAIFTTTCGCFFLCGKPMMGLLNIIILTLCFFIPGAIHALFVVNGHLADKRTEKIVNAIKDDN